MAGGNINIVGCEDTGNLNEVKVWLVLSADVDCDTPEMIAWNCASYLFENGLISYEVSGLAPSANSTVTTTWASIKSK